MLFKIVCQVRFFSPSLLVIAKSWNDKWGQLKQAGLLSKQYIAYIVHSKGNQSWLFTGRTDAEAETPILWPPHAKSWLIGKTLMLGGIGGRRRRGRQRMRWLGGITDSMDMGLGGLRQAWRDAVHGVTGSRTRVSDWTELNIAYSTQRCDSEQTPTDVVPPRFRFPFLCPLFPSLSGPPSLIGYSGGRMDTYMCMAESLCSSSETIRTLLIGYTSKHN